MTQKWNDNDWEEGPETINQLGGRIGFCGMWAICAMEK